MEILPHLAQDWSAIGHALGHFSNVVETASMCEWGISIKDTLFSLVLTTSRHSFSFCNNNEFLYSAFHNNHIIALYISVLVIGPILLESIQPELPYRSKGFFIHNINFYSHRMYPFIPLGEEMQLL